MIDPKCVICKQELNEFGGIVLVGQEIRKYAKSHLCKRCWEIVWEEFEDKTLERICQTVLLSPPRVEGDLEIVDWKQGSTLNYIEASAKAIELIRE